ncbi:zinc finger, c3HC4 type (RING finger) domain-containing protein [Ditylenchus destructor]|uniref:Zinc finger, c3HC4 type (RING finger) domain-containing protein n=1 Tax=Ditylenchus destructor TaxID=166010 RepID=A0AAD4N314_9BILA|nr:zinc finger, c3HC4 type (RING finger) domain-containing protein [Ditylenchus destructor]
MAEMVCSQNAFLVQKLTELGNSVPSTGSHSTCECSRLRAEVENKSAHLKQAYGAMNDLKKRAMGQRNVDQICLRCGGAERQVVSLPCAHVGVCKACAKLTNNCFICGRKQDSCLEISFRR